MKSNTLVSLLAAAAAASTGPLALAAPVPIVLVEDLGPAVPASAGERVGGGHPLAPISEQEPGRQQQAALQQPDAPLPADILASASRRRIDNRPIRPIGAGAGPEPGAGSETGTAAALAAPVPLETTYLMSLARGGVSRSQQQQQQQKHQNAAEAATGSSSPETIDIIIVNTLPPHYHHRGDGRGARLQEGEIFLDSSSLASLSSSSSSSRHQLELAVAARHHRLGMPCYYYYNYAQLRREYNDDLMVVSLVATFLLVIVVVELWEGAYQRATRFARRYGHIRLPEGEGDNAYDDFDYEDYEDGRPYGRRREVYADGEYAGPYQHQQGYTAEKCACEREAEDQRTEPEQHGYGEKEPVAILPEADPVEMGVDAEAAEKTGAENRSSA